ncbi:MAG: NFACT RNA binding domain-containing protein [Candidatus Anstonellales archaeon]
MAKDEKTIVELDASKSAQENASTYFEMAKKAKVKLSRVKAALAQSILELEKLKSEKQKDRGSNSLRDSSSQLLSLFSIKRKKEWFEQFHFFVTPQKKLVIAGRSSKQNDLIYSKYIEDNDLFFHADIQGAPATVLKNGLHADNPEKLLSAQFAASYSSAWKVGAASVDVYAVRKNQLSKHSHGGFIPKGGFAITGEREWFRKIPLGLKLYVDEKGIPRVVPEKMNLMHNSVLIYPRGKDDKQEAAKKIAKALSCDKEEILLLLPSGKFRVISEFTDKGARG